MAEFGIATGVLQVAGFGAEVGSALYRTLRDIKHAPRDIEALGKEVDATSAVLRSVGHLLGNPKTTSLHTQQLIVDTQNVLKGCNDVFSELEDAARVTLGGIREQGTWRRLSLKAKWPLSKGRVTEISGKGEAQPLTEAYSTSDQLQGLEQRLEFLITTRVGTHDIGLDIDSALDSAIMLPKDSQPLHWPGLSREDLSEPSLKPSSRLQNFSSVKSNQRTLDGAAPRFPSGNTAPSMHSLVAQAGNLSQPGHHTDLLGDVQARPSQARRELSGSTLAPSVHAKSKSLLHADLERCKDAVDQLAATLTAALVALQSGDEVHNDSTDITAALIEALEQAKHLPAGLRCEGCKRRIAWRHVGQQGLCGTGHACQVRGMASRMVSPEHTIRQVQSEHLVQRHAVRDVQIKPDRTAAQSSSRQPDVASASRPMVTKRYSDDRLDEPSRTSGRNTLSSKSQRTLTPAELELLSQTQRIRETRSHAPRPGYQHSHQQIPSKPTSGVSALDGNRILRRKPPLRPKPQHSSISTSHRSPAAMFPNDGWRESNPHLAPLSSSRPISRGHEIEEARNLSYVAVARSVPSAMVGLRRTRSQGLAPQPTVNTYNDAISGTDDRVPYPPTPQSLAAGLLHQTEAEARGGTGEDFGSFISGTSSERGSPLHARVHHSPSSADGDQFRAATDQAHVSNHLTDETRATIIAEMQKMEAETPEESPATQDSHPGDDGVKHARRNPSYAMGTVPTERDDAKHPIGHRTAKRSTFALKRSFPDSLELSQAEERITMSDLSPPSSHRVAGNLGIKSSIHQGAELGAGARVLRTPGDIMAARAARQLAARKYNFAQQTGHDATLHENILDVPSSRRCAQPADSTAGEVALADSQDCRRSQQDHEEYLSVPEDPPERSAAEKAAATALERFLNETRTLGESRYYGIATRAASDATTEEKSHIRAQLAESMAAARSLTPPIEPEDRSLPAEYELRSGSADRGSVYSAESAALPNCATVSGVPFIALSHDTDSLVAKESVAALLRRWLVKDT